MRRSYYFAVFALGLKLAFSCGSEAIETRGSLAEGTKSNADTCKKNTALNLVDPVNYEGQLKAFLDVSCAAAGCHTGNNPPKNIQLGTYIGTKANIVASISAIEGNRMPINGKPKPSAAQIQLMKDWMATGFTEKAPVAPGTTPTPKPASAPGTPAGAAAPAGQASEPTSSKTGSASKTSKSSVDCN